MQDVLATNQNHILFGCVRPGHGDRAHVQDHLLHTDLVVLALVIEVLHSAVDVAERVFTILVLVIFTSCQTLQPIRVLMVFFLTFQSAK